MSSPSTDFPWLKVKASPIAKVPCPARVGGLASADLAIAVYRQMFMDYLSTEFADAKPHYLATFTAMLTEPPQPPSGWSADDFDVWRNALDGAFGLFREEAERLRRAVAERGDDVDRAVAGRLAADLAGSAATGTPEWVSALLAVQGTMQVKQQVADMLAQVGELTRAGFDLDTARTKRLGTPFIVFSEAEGALRAAINSYSAAATTENLQELAARLLTYSSAAQGFGEGIKGLADDTVTWARDYAKTAYKENLANVDENVNAGLLGMKTCVYLIGGMLTAVGIAFPPAAIAGTALGIAAMLIEKAALEYLGRERVKDDDFVKQMLTTQFGIESGEPSKVKEALETATSIQEKYDWASTAVEISGDIAHDAGTEAGRRVVEGIETVTKPLAMTSVVVGVVASGADMAMTFYDADAKAERPRFDPAETQKLLAAFDHVRSQQGAKQAQLPATESVLHGYVGDGNFEATVGGVRGTLNWDTKTFQPNHDEVLRRFAHSAGPGPHYVNTFDHGGVMLTITGEVSLAAAGAGSQYDAKYATLWLTLPVTYTTAAGDWTHTDVETQQVGVEIDGTVHLTGPSTVPAVPIRISYPDYLAPDHLLDDANPFLALIRIDDHDGTRVANTVAQPDPGDRQAFDRWLQQVHVHLADEARDNALGVTNYGLGHDQGSAWS